MNLLGLQGFFLWVCRHFYFNTAGRTNEGFEKQGQHHFFFPRPNF